MTKMINARFKQKLITEVTLKMMKGRFEDKKIYEVIYIIYKYRQMLILIKNNNLNNI